MTLIPGSSVVEQAAVNRLAGGSNPSPGANWNKGLGPDMARPLSPQVSNKSAAQSKKAPQFDLAAPSMAADDIQSVLSKCAVACPRMCNLYSLNKGHIRREFELSWDSPSANAPMQSTSSLADCPSRLDQC